VSQYQKGKTNLDFTEARDSEWQWHQVGRKSVPHSILITMPAPHHSVFLQAGCPSCRPTNSVKELKEMLPSDHSSKSAAAACRRRMMGQTNTQMDRQKPGCHTDAAPHTMQAVSIMRVVNDTD